VVLGVLALSWRLPPLGYIKTELKKKIKVTLHLWVRHICLGSWTLHREKGFRTVSLVNLIKVSLLHKDKAMIRKVLLNITF
jgi:hypothetical protein